ncbi:hypothetical protein SAMN05421743_10977 [Thalassobacillus cyri]|uniref:Uncharacterized protein n=1 Tax=Thalassobacillus cyri TaxID=571932 RepID=A0A1H4EHS7_9BACI|nr:hypothetical protein [Thalassobacillus cyri]SEA84583.1 hypothetical protein SAMN05421743_10977 [Thalassobacillus cyri]
MADHQNVHVESSPHFDGEKESIINDPAIARNGQMGVTTEKKQSFHRTHSQIQLKTSKNMYKFEKIMRGKRLN